MADTFDWYYPQPVTTVEAADDEIEQISDQPSTQPVQDDGGGTGWSATGVASTIGQNAEIDINELSLTNPLDVQFSNFNDYLTDRGLPSRSGFFSSTDFSSLGAQAGPGSKTMAGIATALTNNPMIGFVGSALGPTREVKDPTGKYSRYIHETGIFNAIASMKIAEEYRDLGEIKAAYQKNPAAGAAANGFVMHVNGRPVYQMPGSRYWKHNLGAGVEISELQGNNLARLSVAENVKNAILKGDDPNGWKGGGITNQDTFISTPSGGYNLDGSFNFGGETSSRYGKMEDIVSVGDQLFEHVTNANANLQASMRKSYATEVIEGLRSMPPGTPSTVRTNFINSVVTRSRGTMFNKPTFSTVTPVTPDVFASNLASKAQEAGAKIQSNFDLDKALSNRGNYDTGGYDDSDLGAGVESSMGDAGGGLGAESFSDFSEEAYGGKIGYAWGGSVDDDASDDEMGDVETMSSSYSADPDAFADEDAGMYDGGNDDNNNNDTKKDITVKPSVTTKSFQRDIVKELRDLSLTPEQRYAVNAMAEKLGMNPAGTDNIVAAPKKGEDFFDTPLGSFLNKAAAAGMQALALQALGIPMGFNQGATIGRNRIDGSQSGFIQAPPSQATEAETVADNIPMEGDVGGEIINASAVKEAGEADIAKMIADAEKYARANGKEISDNGEKDGILVSKGEVYIKKDLADIIGRDKIRKINNRGKKDTRRKIQETQAAAEGGFIKKKYAEGDTVLGRFRKSIGTDSPSITMQDVVGPQQDGFLSGPQIRESIPEASPSTALPRMSRFESRAYNLLELLEGNHPEAYVPKGRSKSGVTVGIGFDIGQHSVKDLERMGLSSDMISKLTPYTKKIGKAAKEILRYDPLTLSDKETKDINTIVLRKKLEDFERVYPEYNNVRDEGKRAVLFSTYFGGGLGRYKTFRNEFDKAQNMDRALRRGLLNILPRGAVEHNRAKKALNWYRDYKQTVMPIPRPKPVSNPSATR